MVERLIDHNNGQYIRDILGADAKTKHLVPSWADLDVLDCLKKALGPLAELTDVMCGDQYVTVSSLKALYYKLRTDTLKEDPADPDLVNELKSNILEELTTKCAGSSDVINTSSFLDPRFKVRT